MIVGENLNSLDVKVPSDAYYTQKDSPTFNAYITIIVRDSNRNIVNIHRQRSHSPTQNFILYFVPIYYLYSNNISITITNTSNTTYTNSSNPSFGISYPSNQSNKPSYLVMIAVGSGSQSNAYNAYNLAAPIANGTGTGQLVYGSPSISTSITVSGSSAYFYISQTFNNNSGGTVTITEVGIITGLAQLIVTGSVVGSTVQLLVWYDVLSSSISVPNGGSVTIYYTFTVNP
jgi:hypothetical protein